MLADELERLLIFSRGAIFQPEQLVRLQHLAQVGGFLRGVAMVSVVQQVMIEPVGLAQFLKQFRHIVQRLARIPSGDRGQRRIGWFIIELAPPHPIGILDAGHPGLGADRLVTHVDIVANRFHRFCNVAAIGMAINHHPIAAAPAEQLVQRHAGHLGLDIPQGNIDRGHCAHRHRPAAPIGTAIKVLPDILDPARIHADQARDHVVFQIGHHRKLAPVQRRIADTIDALIRDDLESDEISPRTGYNHLGRYDFHDVALN